MIAKRAIPKGNKPNTIKYIKIFDIDGVLLSSLHRYATKTIKGKEKLDLDYWVENQHLCVNDSILPHAELYKKSIQTKNTFVIIATSRLLLSDDYMTIGKLLGMPDGIVSRLHDEQDTQKMKIKGIERIINDCNLHHVKSDNIIMYEDNAKNLKSICDHFQCLGVYVPSKQGH